MHDESEDGKGIRNRTLAQWMGEQPKQKRFTIGLLIGFLMAGLFHW